MTASGRWLHRPAAGARLLRASAPLRLPPPPPRSPAAASPGRPPPATCCPGREEREPRPQTFVSGRRLLPAPSAAGPGEGGGMGMGMGGGWSPEPAPALKDTAPGAGLPCPLSPCLPRCPNRAAMAAGLPGCPSDRQDGRSAFRTFGLPRARAAPRADAKSPCVAGRRSAGTLTSLSLRCSGVRAGVFSLLMVFLLSCSESLPPQRRKNIQLLTSPKLGLQVPYRDISRPLE